MKELLEPKVAGVWVREHTKNLGAPIYFHIKFGIQLRFEEYVGKNNF